MKKYTATSNKIDSALEKALRLAERDIPTPDGVFKWKMVEVTGRRGGLFVTNSVTVVIEVDFK